jgi:hypothetical protein
MNTLKEETQISFSIKDGLGFLMFPMSCMCLHSFLGDYLWDTQGGFNELYKANLRSELGTFKVKVYLGVTLGDYLRPIT